MTNSPNKLFNILNFIGGEFCPPASGKYLDNFEPATGLVYSHTADSDERDVEAAIAAAESARAGWALTPVAARSRILHKMADLIERDLTKFAEAEARDNGKPIHLCTDLDIPRAITNLRFFGSAILSQHGETFFTDQTALNYTRFTPLGTVACISPWNLPLYLLTWKIAPAIATGNTVVAKPSEITPLTASLLCEVAREAGLPKGVLNIVHGLGPKVGEPLLHHKKIQAISFTGSTATGRRISQAAAQQFKRVSLEMGGKNANVVFADCDFDKALDTSVRSSFSNQGQICLCGSRILVEKTIYHKFRDALVLRARALRIGPSLNKSSDQGALVSEAHLQKVLGCIARAKAEGGKILCGGLRADITKEHGAQYAKGYYLEPTLIEGLGPNTATNQEEIFGPVATLIPFETEAEAIELANCTNYGLSASIWTQDIDRGHRVAHAIESGLVWVNTWMIRDLRTPFGGVKESGVGREGGAEALRFFSEVKNICVALAPAQGAPR